MDNIEAKLAYERLCKNKELRDKLKKARIQDERIQWLYQLSAEIYDEWRSIKEPLKERQYRYEKIARMAKDLSAEIYELRKKDRTNGDFFVEDYEIRKKALSLKPPGVLQYWEEQERPIGLRIGESSENCQYPIMLLEDYLAGFAAYLREKAKTLPDRFEYKELVPASKRKTNLKSFTIRYIKKWIDEISNHSTYPPLNIHNKNVLIAEVASVVLEKRITPNQVTQMFPDTRRHYCKE